MFEKKVKSCRLVIVCKVNIFIDLVLFKNYNYRFSSLVIEIKNNLNINLGIYLFLIFCFLLAMYEYKISGDNNYKQNNICLKIKLYLQAKCGEFLKPR